MLIARLAWQRLDPGTRQRVAAVLRAHPAYAYWQAQVPTGADVDVTTCALAATWPDKMRDRKMRRKFDIARADVHANWHYIDVPLTFDRTPLPPIETPNIETALAACNHALRNPSTPLKKRAVMLVWLLHLMGDVHQPLHCASRYSAAQPHGDRGGNLWIVRLPDGSLSNLHKVWDAALHDTPAEAQAIPAPDPTLLARHLRPADWVAESSDVARSVAYANGSVPGAPRLGRKHVPEVATPLSEAYLHRIHGVARAQAALAAARLAHCLEEDFKR